MKVIHVTKVSDNQYIEGFQTDSFIHAGEEYMAQVIKVKPPFDTYPPMQHVKNYYEGFAIISLKNIRTRKSTSDFPEKVFYNKDAPITVLGLVNELSSYYSESIEFTVDDDIIMPNDTSLPKDIKRI